MLAKNQTNTLFITVFTRDSM